MSLLLPDGNARMCSALITAFLLMKNIAALARGCRIGDLGIIHPVIMAPVAHANHNRAHVEIINLGKGHECLLEAKIFAAASPHLLSMAGEAQGRRCQSGSRPDPYGHLPVSI